MSVLQVMNQQLMTMTRPPYDDSKFGYEVTAAEEIEDRV